MQAVSKTSRVFHTVPGHQPEHPDLHRSEVCVCWAKFLKKEDLDVRSTVNSYRYFKGLFEQDFKNVMGLNSGNSIKF